MKPLEQGGVVDERLNVYGVQNLKIAGNYSITFAKTWYILEYSFFIDCSIAPGNVGANTYNTAIAIGEKAAVIIAEDLGIKGVTSEWTWGLDLEAHRSNVIIISCKFSCSTLSAWVRLGRARRKYLHASQYIFTISFKFVTRAKILAAVYYRLWAFLHRCRVQVHSFKFHFQFLCAQCAVLKQPSPGWRRTGNLLHWQQSST